MTTVYLIRHAQSEGNLYRRILGWQDGKLTPTGREQAAALAPRFRNIPLDAIYSSDLLRARDTAQAIARIKGLEIRTEAGFREVNLGELSDIPYGEFLHRQPQLYEAFFACSAQWDPQEGESFQQVAERMTDTLFRTAAQHHGGTVAIVSHAMAIRCLQAALRGKHPGEFAGAPLGENTAVSCYEIQGDRFRVVFENDVCHLPPRLTATGLRAGREPTPLVWFRSMDLGVRQEARFYHNARRDAWEGLHGSLKGFDGPGFLDEAREQLLWDPRAVQQVMFQEQPIGLLQLATLQGAAEGVGHVPFFYLREDCRGRGIGGQLLGQAVSVYRDMGRKRLRLLCDPENGPAQRFYGRHGFIKTGQAPGSMGMLDVLEMEL